MAWTSHDQFFGFIHGFKINRNNMFFGGKSGINDTPYPAIVNQPSFIQVVNNWNTSDTGLVLTFFVLGLAISRRMAAKDLLVESIIEKRVEFKRYHRITVAVGIFLALRNSSYRLEGYVPNGLPKKQVDNVVKYDYTSQIINNTLWRYFFEPQDKPTNL